MLVWVIIAVIILSVGSKIITNIIGTTDELKALNNLKETVEAVCSPEGQESLGVSLVLPKAEQGSGNPKLHKLHLVPTGELKLYKCVNLGSGCSGGEKIKSKKLSCPRLIRFGDCWVAPPAETTQVTVTKQNNLLKFEQTPGVFCN